MAKKATSMHEIDPNAGGFGDPDFMLPASIKNIESAPVEDTTSSGIDLGSHPEDDRSPGRELGM